jgi:GntR family transcriptional regulator
VRQTSFRLRLANREPMGVQTAFIPLDLTPGIAKIKFGGASLYDVLQARFGLFTATARETYCVTLLKRDVAALLGVSARSPAMTAERVTFLADGRPLEYVQSIMRGDRYTVAIDLTRHPSRPA